MAITAECTYERGVAIVCCVKKPLTAKALRGNGGFAFNLYFNAEAAD